MRELLATQAAQIEREQIEWLDQGRVPIGLVTVLAGVGGLGKSQWTCLLAARLSLGELGELGDCGDTLLATAEDSPSTTVVPRLQALGADLARIHFVTIKTKDGDEDGIELPRDLPALADAIRDLGARLLVIDPLVAHLPTTIDAHRDQSVRRALAPLYRLAKETGCAVVAVLHLNKAQGLAPLARLGGSTGFGNAARSVLLLDRDPDDPDGDMGNRRVLAHIKCNVAPLASSLLYRIAPMVLPAEGTAPMVKTSRLELVGESEYDGRALLGDEEARTALGEAVDFLRDYLSDGKRHEASEIFKEAEKLRINDRVLRNARKKLGARTEKTGFRKGWEWWLPREGERHSADLAQPSEEARLSDSSPSLDSQGDTHPPRGTKRKEGEWDTESVPFVEPLSDGRSLSPEEREAAKRLVDREKRERLARAGDTIAGEGA